MNATFDQAATGRSSTSDLLSNVTLRTAITLLLIFSITIVASRARKTGQPPSLSDPIPYIYNTFQFVYQNEKFMDRVRTILKTTKIAKFHLGFRPVYLLTGSKNVQAIFGRSQNVDNYDIMLGLNLPKWYKFSKQDLKRFSTDKSGRGKTPLPGTENTMHRYFHGYEHVHVEFFGKPQYVNPLVEKFTEEMDKVLDKYTDQESTVLSVRDFCKHHVSKCATLTLLGPKPFEVDPNFEDLMWAFDDEAFHIALGLPKWLFPRPHQIHEKYLEASRKYLELSEAAFDSKDPTQAAAPWDPSYGARGCREILKYFEENGFKEPNTGAGAMAILLWAANSNVIPLSLWMIFEVAKDPALVVALREELNTAYNIDPTTSARTLNLQKVAALPLLTSVYTETLRLSMSFNVVRNVRQTFTLDGFTIPKGSWVQAPTLIAHYEDDVWGADGHPAGEFWAERHIKWVDGRRTFDMGGRSGSYFPYGGGNLICPGRNLAKLEMTLTVALLIARFDVESLGWTHFDGLPSDRPAKHLGDLCGGGTAQPDRDMKIRIKPLKM